MKKIALIVLGLLMIILGMSVLDKFLFLGISLNMLLIYTGILALQTDIKTNYICVFAVACIYDLLISPFFGINIVWTLAATFVARTIMDKLYEEKSWSSIILFIAITILFIVYQYVVGQLLFVPTSWSYLPSIFARSIPIHVFFGIILNGLLRPLIRHIMKNWW